MKNVISQERWSSNRESLKRGTIEFASDCSVVVVVFMKSNDIWTQIKGIKKTAKTMPSQVSTTLTF